MLGLFLFTLFTVWSYGLIGSSMSIPLNRMAIHICAHATPIGDERRGHSFGLIIFMALDSFILRSPLRCNPTLG
uniref:Putative secreted protein n=1 Tax=Ixodes ricinus TaxID=34613 RepID=A0A6B0TUW1_IXORI